MTDHIKADIGVEKAPETAKNIREYVRKYGVAGLTTDYPQKSQLTPREGRSPKGG